MANNGDVTKDKGASQDTNNNSISYDDALAYLPPPDSFYVQEGLRDKLVRKTSENPFVPVGVIFTTIVLGFGLKSITSNNPGRSQLMMRLRVGGQAFAVLAMLGGVYYKGISDNRNR